MICICFSTSISRSAAWTTSSMPARPAASSAPRCMSRKKGWLSVFITNATRGLPPPSVAGARLQPLTPAIGERCERDGRRDPVPTFWCLCHLWPPHVTPIGAAPLQHHIHQHGADDHHADHHLLKERRHVQQVQPVAQHAHDQRADQRAGQRAFAAEQAGAADHRRGNRVELVHRPGGRLRRVEPRGQQHRRRRAHQPGDAVDQRLVEAAPRRPTAAPPPRCRQSRTPRGRTPSATARSAPRDRSTAVMSTGAGIISTRSVASARNASPKPEIGRPSASISAPPRATLIIPSVTMNGGSRPNGDQQAVDQPARAADDERQRRIATGTRHAGCQRAAPARPRPSPAPTRPTGRCRRR